MYMDLDYWSLITYQELNNNSLLNEKLGIIWQVGDGSFMIIDGGIQPGYLERMCCSQSGMFHIPTLTSDQRARLHGWDCNGYFKNERPIYKCEPILGKLYTNAFG
jgi:hypothetical protein